MKYKVGDKVRVRDDNFDDIFEITAMSDSSFPYEGEAYNVTTTDGEFCPRISNYPIRENEVFELTPLEKLL